VADYSEFPTTPTAWQEVDEWPTEDPPPPVRRGVDMVALIPGVLFSLLAIALLADADIPLLLFRDGGVLWVLLIGGGALMLVGELRKARRRR
jgi:hypothetical protein